ncbi:low molecular weight phosphatase family protein [Muriicola sp. Z0-33]|uniref:arsenate-mycothiol transferase ArsC n=1 Tax=Muriicola sp. Z0-33 TaxID=2816957 RepID=UPI002238ADA8|nr:protein-tyrosine-phosphatase [Muriicola sp. Z0-33]MCW5515994.1 protein-tyrosine-phosphatase [Muriicola sp. Z0-33]
MHAMVFEKIQKTINSLDTKSIPERRKKILQPLIDFLQSKVNAGQKIRLNFICTHNSRRSHLSQVWAQTMAYYFNVNNLSCYSGGTEATALFPMVVTTLKQSGFEILKLSEDNNPIYCIKYADNEHPIMGFSKELDSEFNPKAAFAAIMTCSQADEGCPFVAGAEVRFPVTYEDPKAFDNTEQQAEKYHERSLQIATELFYVFSLIQLNE